MEMNIETLSAQYLPLLSEYLLQYGLQTISALAIFFIGKWLARLATGFLVAQLNKHGVDPMITGFLNGLLYWILLVFILIAALSQLGIQTAQFIAVLGAAGLAVGLALQGSLSNFAAGILIIIFKPFKLGDYIEAGGAAGSVSEIRIFSIQLITPDNKEVIIPNSSVMNSNIINFTAQAKRRVDLKIGVSYDSHLPDVKKLLQEIVATHPKVLKNDANLVAVSELGDSSVNFVVRAWVDTSDYWPVYFELTETIKLKLDEANIKIPFPQMDVHVHKTEA